MQNSHLRWLLRLRRMCVTAQSIIKRIYNFSNYYSKTVIEYYLRDNANHVTVKNKASLTKKALAA